jgi:hypothetical protein
MKTWPGTLNGRGHNVKQGKVPLQIQSMQKSMAAALCYPMCFNLSHDTLDHNMLQRQNQVPVMMPAA